MFSQPTHTLLKNAMVGIGCLAYLLPLFVITGDVFAVDSTPLESYYRYSKWPDLKGISFSKPSDWVSMLVFRGCRFFFRFVENSMNSMTRYILDLEMDPKGNNLHQHLHFLALFIDFLKCSAARTSCPSKLPDSWFVTWEYIYFQAYTKPKHWRLDMLLFLRQGVGYCIGQRLVGGFSFFWFTLL